MLAPPGLNPCSPSAWRAQQAHLKWHPRIQSSEWSQPDPGPVKRPPAARCHFAISGEGRFLLSVFAIRR